MITATRRYLEGLTTALTRETGIQVESGDNWSADIKRRRLQYDASELSQYSPDEAKGFLLHEIGHLKYSEDCKDTKMERNLPIMHQVYNAFEDIRIEKNLSGQYGRFADVPLGATKNLVIDEMKQQTDNSPAAVLRQVLCDTVIRETIFRTEQSEVITGDKIDDYRAKLTDEARRFINNHHGELSNVVSDAIAASSLESLKRVVDKEAYPILKELIDRIPKDEQKKEQVKEAYQSRPKNGHILSTSANKSEFHQIPEDEELDAILEPYINTLARHLGEILKERKAIKLGGLHKTGSLLSKNAYRVMTDETRIFSRRNHPDKYDYKGIFCLDGSGSMRKEKHINTFIGTYLLYKTFTKLGFPCEFIQFNNHAKRLESLGDYREFYGGSNNDKEALQKAIEVLDTTRDNIVLMMSDGSLCTSVSEEVEILRKKGALLIGIGVGINTDELRQAYGKAINVPQVDKLPNALIGLLKTLIHR